MLRTGTGAPVISAMRSPVSRNVPCTAALTMRRERSGKPASALRKSPERSLHRCLDHALLQLIRERACWQLQSFIQRMDARGARPAVAHSLDLDGAKDGLQHASMQAPVGI